ncbi:MAG TPA: B12 lower ligand biosynthesis radical SAM protein BzaD [Thermodesulfovibrionales bacterium]|nr:B12 lower ligand biosynthesis radical SAM protein BzaD [Thermodesulfovibrionales bacterium]
MRVLMVQTPSVESVSSEKVYPIGIVSLASRLIDSGREVDIIDMNLHQDPFTLLKERLLTFCPDVVGLSLRNIDPLGNKTASLIPHFVATVRLVSSILPKACIVAGGTGFALFPERLMRDLPEIRYGLIGEAELTFPRLLRSLDNPPSLKGLCTRKDGRISIALPSRDLDMSRYVPPDRSVLDPSRYLNINTYVPAVGIETKRGCPYECSYCVYPKLQGKRVRCRPPASVVDEMEFLHKEYGIESFHFTDPVVNIPRGHLEEICGEILRRKLKVRWDGFMREDQFNDRNASLFEKAGCECFSFSPDGLCQESLVALGKRLDEEDIFKAARIASKTDVISVYHFMANVPGETETTAQKGARMIERLYDLHRVRKNLGTVVLNNIRILPGTAIEKRARSEGVIGNGTDLLYPTYYNPAPFDTLRYRLETLHFCNNTFIWQEVR